MAVSWNGLAILIMNFTWERVVPTIIPRNESYFAFQINTEANVKGLFVC